MSAQAADVMADAVFLAVKGYVGKAVERANAPLLLKIADLEARLASIPAGPRGEPGERGEPGQNGKNAEVDYDRVGNVIAVAVEKEVAKFPIPRDGRDGKDGVNGRDGANGKDGAAGRDADTEVIVAKVLERMPK